MGELWFPYPSTEKWKQATWLAVAMVEGGRSSGDGATVSSRASDGGGGGISRHGRR